MMARIYTLSQYLGLYMGLVAWLLKRGAAILLDGAGLRGSEPGTAKPSPSP